MKRRLTLQIRRNARHLLTLLALIAVGTTCGIFILQGQRLANPFGHYYTVNGAFPSAAGVVAGLGEPVNVAGVRVGAIIGTSLRGGQALVRMQIDPAKLPKLYRDAHADLVPRTPLEDMQVDISPGHAAAGRLRSSGTIPVAQTLTPVASDELLASLDTDTRTWLQSLFTSLGQATAGRASDLHALLRALGPTASQLRQVGDIVAARHVEVAQLVHDFGAVTRAAAGKNGQLRTLVQAGQQMVDALAGQDAALRRSVARLPTTLGDARTTFTSLTSFAHALGPAATALTPTARTLPATLAHTRTLLRGAALLPLERIRPFVGAAVPLARVLPPLASNLRVDVPALLKTFKVLAYATNELAYNPGSGNRGFLYWLAWFAHDADSFISTSDANGPVWRTVLISSCRQLATPSPGAVLEQLLGTAFGC